MLDFIPVALKNVFSKPATRKYPYVKRAAYDKQKGHIGIEIDNCVFCGMCVRKCPVGALTVNRTERTWTIDRFRCVMCGACSESCPKKCLSIEGDYTAPAAEKAADTFKGKPAPAPAPKAPAPAPKPAAAPVAAPATAQTPAPDDAKPAQKVSSNA